MPDLTAQQLHEIVGPVWKKHPGTRPANLSWGRHTRLGTLTSWEWIIEATYATHIVPSHHAALLCEGQMTRWLEEHAGEVRSHVGVPLPDGGYSCHYLAVGKLAQYRSAPTKIEALAAACLVVPEETDAEVS